jgi:hypothetical protein
MKRAVPLLTFSSGNTRAVICVGSLAFKLARSARGGRCNQFEAKLYRSSNPKRQELLCPPLWCAPFGVMLVMRRANPMTDDEVRKYVWKPRLSWKAWDYLGQGDVGLPFEHKAADWGWLDGRPVAVDYANLDDMSWRR